MARSYTIKGAAKSEGAPGGIDYASLLNEQQLEAVQVRLEALHASKMLSDDEFFALEDLCAELTLETVTKEMTTMMEPVAKLHKLVLLSEKMASDAGFGRQVRRKFV